jgi:hypothetical protein
MTISTFVGLIGQLKETQEFTRDLRSKMEGALKERNITPGDKKFAQVMIDLANRYDEELKSAIGGAANLALTHGNEPHDKIVEAMSK